MQLNVTFRIIQNCISGLIQPVRSAYQPPASSTFSFRTNQPPATSQPYFSLRTNQHQPSATSQTNSLILSTLRVPRHHPVILLTPCATCLTPAFSTRGLRRPPPASLPCPSPPRAPSLPTVYGWQRGGSGSGGAFADPPPKPEQ
jgi:hypothetical protein